MYLLVVLLISWNSSHGQFIRFTINLPAGFEAKPEPTSPQILEPPFASNEINPLGPKKQGTRWIEFRSRENVFLAVNAKLESRGGGLPVLYFLNDNTSNFNEAKQLGRAVNVLPMFNEMKLMKDMPNETTYLSAWLGLPSHASGTLTIEFH